MKLRNCAVCGHEFPLAATGRPGICCSDECRREHKNRNEQARRARRAGQRPGRCDWCGHAFLKERSTTRYCTMSCAQQAFWNDGRSCQLQWETCIVCARRFLRRGQRFNGKGNVAHICSSGCRHRQRNRRAVVIVERRRAAKKSRPSDYYTISEIAERDHHQCGLCGGIVDMTIPWPLPGSRSIDHVVPYSKGGDNTKANVQLAHLGCNVRKNSGGSQQLALIG